MRLPLAVRAVLAMAIPITVAGIVPWVLLEPTLPPIPPWRYLMVIPMAGGLLFAGWAVLLFFQHGRGTLAPIDPPTVFVAHGPYRVTRNPMYVGITCWLLSWAALTGSRVLTWYALLLPVGFHLFVRFVEEPVLRRRFGAAYETYTRQVPRWIVGERRRLDA